MPDIPEHPDIASALQTGYPVRSRVAHCVTCMDCAKELTGADLVFDYDGDALCESCFLDRLTADLGAQDIAARMGFIVKDADTYKEEMEEEDV